MSEQDRDEPSRALRRDRHEHGGLPAHPDDDALASLTEEERTELGLEPYDPDEVPPAADAPVPTDITETEEYQEERAEVRREYDKDELLVEGEREQFPPTRYDNK
ncbi:MAG TPA: hypothetical protein VG253_28780 [Streptosporangiaceae bacterium]|jgi:hypothetical protein|nr:hypothetical protein [Streptosporangiaceae bacterium]